MESNPWQVNSIESFSHFHCPECNFFVKEEKSFEDHAIGNHPQSYVLFDPEVENLNDDIQKNASKQVKIPIIKTEEFEKLENSMEIDEDVDSSDDHEIGSITDPLSNETRSLNELEKDKNNDHSTKKQDFKDVSDKYQAKIWNHCLMSQTKPQAKCIYCSALLTMPKGGTNLIYDHLLKMHSIEISKLQDPKQNIVKLVIEEKEKDTYEDVSAKYKSKIWGHFFMNANKPLAKCIHCSAFLGIPKGSTNLLSDHLMEKHAINISKSDVPKNDSEKLTSKKYNCSKCGMKFISKRDYDRHYLMHFKNEKPYKCAKCTSTYYDERSLKSHIE